MTRTISKLEVYPDVMLQEIVAARGTYATNGAKGFLAKHLDRLSAEESYRVVQLASFNVFDPGETWLSLRMRKNSAPEDMDRALAQALEIPSVETTSIQHLLMRGQLRPTSRLKTATAEKVEQWNEMLRNFFAAPQTVEKWNALFTPSALLPHDSYLYEQGLSW